MYKPVFMVISACHRLFPEIWGLPPLSLVGGKGQNSYLYNKGEFFKKTFKGTIRKLLNVEAAHMLI
jgi:hypothetical protein